ncbi:MAG TPA: hypothetical protein VMZ28_02155 [Kofleriaceae bacterium]|nr:hypothetical protein [Kofleriaceae bacterium]
MAYLYGDSTESALELNYIEFLRDALEFSVEVLVAEHRITGLQDGTDERKRQVEVELGLLRTLSENVVQALAQPVGGPQTAAHRTAAQIRQSSEDLIKRAAGNLKQSMGDHLAGVGAQVQRERGSNMRALEILLRNRELPDSQRHLEVTLEAGGTRYAAQVRGKSDLGIEWVQALDVPAAHLFAHAIKVEKLSPNLEVRVPEKGGWMRKGMRMRSHRISGKYVTDFVRATAQTTIKLRETANEDDSGYNVLVTSMAPRVRLVRVQKGGEHSPPFEPLEEDVPKFLDLADHLWAAAEELINNRGALKEARLDGKPLADHEQPSLMVKRLIAKMAPVVQEIARHSLSPDELVLKRILAGDRREEVFASKADLLAKLDPVPLTLRGVFAPLGLGDLGRPGAGGNGRQAPIRLDTHDPGIDPDTKEITISPAPPTLPGAPRSTEPMRSVVDTLRSAVATGQNSPPQRPPSTPFGHGSVPPPPGYPSPPGYPNPPGLAPARPAPTIPPVPTPVRPAQTHPVPQPIAHPNAPTLMQQAAPAGGTRPGVGNQPEATSVAGTTTVNDMPSPMQTLRHPDDEDITVVAAAIPKRPTKPPEDSIDVALNELEQEN